MKAPGAGAMIVAVALLGGAVAHAHDSRPLSIELSEREDGVYALSWRVPPAMPVQAWPAVTLAGDTCAPAFTAMPATGSTHATYFCPQGIGNHEVRIAYPVVNPSLSTLVRVSWLSGESRVLTAGPDADRLAVPAASTFTGVARAYVVLGVQHILAGPDHLLFLACLLWLARTPRRIVVAITGFTLGHSATLALATLGVVHVPVAAMEACIALSVMFLAAEIARGRRDTLTWRRPLVVSLAFGLLHGFGFASVLSEIGVPQTQIATALLFFNVGVELGQLAFAAAFLGLVAGLRKLAGSAVCTGIDLRAPRAQAVLAWTSPYVIGTVAAFWFVERASSF
jgi:hydrogenase/urease accessory protein HupE